MLIIRSLLSEPMQQNIPVKSCKIIWKSYNGAYSSDMPI